ncbi:hypothetical protein SAMN05216558_5592 [Pseudomonas vancouverensis]|nr:hypothetical protein SAMN05216558_5592 [Pseudomonas vancouverensis]
MTKRYVSILLHNVLLFSHRGKLDPQLIYFSWT